MKKTSVKRRFAAWLLLLVYVPMMVAISLHVHDEEHAETACVQCVNHVAHHSHVGAYADGVQDCVLCQFASLPYVAATVVAVVAALYISRVAYTTASYATVRGVCDVISARAPPLLVSKSLSC